MAWTTPVTYVPGDPLTATDMNKISEDLNYLYDPVSLILTNRGAGSNIATASTSLVAVDAVLFGGTITTTGRALRLGFDAVLQHSVVSALMVFDILIDGVTYASSMTSTPVTNGLWVMRCNATANTPNNFSGTHLVPAGTLSAASHSFALVWKSPGGNNTLVLSGSSAQLRISE